MPEPKSGPQEGRGGGSTSPLPPLVKAPPGRASRDLSDLCPCLRPVVEDFIAACKFQGYPLRIVEVLRDPERQAHYLRTNVSWTTRSRHLPQLPNGKSLAIDLCPEAYLPMKGWNPEGPIWEEMARLAYSRNLLWGGDWKQKDRPHFEWRKCQCTSTLSA